ncbi:restriction endonuclease subunit S [Streptomyces dangxiongensis]|uniref:restriction endonuclease subunit S n=1 Tax=Streptomyces dangxiongensis TaxID=1442032 RepID=UPI0013CEAC4E|nr:hypothetical protein [Streptomyces dangxiongensis]
MVLREVRLGDVLQLERIAVDVDPDAEYRQIGVRSFGNGIFHRDPCLGSELSKLKYFEVVPGRLVVSNIMAWEGAIGVSTKEEDGFVGSARFLSYRPIGEVDLRYLNYFFQSDAGKSLIKSVSTGTVARNQTVSPRNFESAIVPLPDMAEQRRVADRLDAAMETRIRLHEKISGRAALVSSTLDALEAQVFDDCLARGWKSDPMHSFAEVNPKTERPGATENVAFVPMAALSDFKGEIDGASYKAAGDVGSGYKLFRRGDVVFARITPCMQNGKSAIFQDDLAVHGFGSTEFHVIRAHAEGDNRWIHRIVRSRRFRDTALPFMTGTAGQQRVPAQYLRNVEIPIPPNSAAREAALKALDRIHEQRVRFRDLHIQEVGSVKCLRSALLDAAFSGRI